MYVTEPREEVGILMSEVESESVEWLWEGRIPLGKITIYDGDPGKGKSVSTMDLAARITTGRPFPHEQVEHLEQVGGVVIISAEDGLADTIKPRLEAADADTSKVVAISTVSDVEGNEQTLSIPKDIATIEEAIARVNAKLVIIDPLMAFLSGNANHDQDVRKAMTPLSKMAEKTGVAVLCVRHMSKKESENALYHGGGSIGIIGTAMSGLVVETHPDDKEPKVLAITKNILGKKADSLTYNITTADNGACKVEWGGTIDLDANDLVTTNGTELGRAKTWLREELSKGRRWCEDVKKAAQEAEISAITLRRARQELGIKIKKIQGRSYWALEDAQLAQDAQPVQGVQDALYDHAPPF
jgi:archaellum biogenesis ATPase FlaH